MNLSTHVENIISAINNELIGGEVAGVFFPNGNPIPAERDLWDYKETIAEDKVSYAELAKDISAFYNSFGGYILIGIKEEVRDEKFIICGYERPVEFTKKLRGALESYCSSGIAITAGDFTVNENKVAYIYIPQRPPAINPVFLTQNGPESKRGKIIFCGRSTYFRQGDRVTLATISQDWQFLNSARNPKDRLSNIGITVSANPVSRLVPNNLPDRNLICAHLYGREDVISNLWAWIADDLEPVRLLAGAGGKGKTSIAYEFASRFFKNAPLPYYQVLWLSAKKRQFRADRNEYIDLPECWYSSPKELLEALSVSTAAATEVEAKDLTEYALQKKLKESLQHIPSFVIVDDIDSLDANEQRRVFELVQKLSSGATSKFLLTTRANYAFSNEQCIEVKGLKDDAYLSFVNDRLKRLNLSEINTRQVRDLQKHSDGSPLWTESLLRLMKQGYSFNEAIKEWLGKPGEDARSAALQKELNALSRTAKRILYVASVLRECSRAELLNITKVGRAEFDGAITELQTLFLVDAPKLIKEEPRFSVPESTATAVFDVEVEVVEDHKRLRNAAKEYSKRAAASRGNRGRNHVGLIINQTMALLRSGSLAEALATVEHALSKQPKNPDLLLLKGRCLGNTDSSKAAEALSFAYVNGQRKSLLFELWYKATSDQKQYAATLDVANLALDHIPEQSKWLPLRARAHIQIALMRNRDGDCNSAVDLLMKASEDLRKTSDLVKESKEEQAMYLSDLESVHDTAWKLASADDRENYLLAYDVAIFALKQHDTRTSSFDRLNIATARLIPIKKTSPSSSSERAAQSRISEALNILRSFSPSSLSQERSEAWEKSVQFIENL